MAWQISDFDALVSIAQIILRLDGADERLPTREDIGRAVSQAATLVPISAQKRVEAHNELAARYTLGAMEDWSEPAPERPAPPLAAQAYMPNSFDM